MVSDDVSRLPPAPREGREVTTKRPPAVELVGGVLLGAVCAVAAKFLFWLLPLMMQVGD